MVNPALKRLPYGIQWGMSIGVGIVTWFVAVSFVRLLPAPLQLLSMLIPIACFSYGLYVLPRWKDEGKRRDLIESLKEREYAHRIMQQHHLNIATDDIEFNSTMRELEAMYPVDNPADRTPSGTTPHSQLALPEQATYLLKVQQEVMQSCGDIGWALVEWASGSGSKYCGQDGWISVEGLRANWGKKYGLKTDDLKTLLSALVGIQIGEWRNSELKEWRLILTL